MTMVEKDDSQGGKFYNFTLQHLLGRNAAKESIIAIHVHPEHIDLVAYILITCISLFKNQVPPPFH